MPAPSATAAGAASAPPGEGRDLVFVATGLGKRFVVKGSKQAVQALDAISIEIPRGSLTAIVGPDGAGKTTLLRLAAGLLLADSGTLRVLGIDVARQPQAVQDRISYMPQRFGLYDDLSVQENLDLYADLHGVPKPERVGRYARLMEMTDLGRFTTRLAGKLSGGMKQKLGLACTLVRSPELLLLDEPTVGVDPLSRRELWQIVEQLVADEKLSVIVSTAYLDEAERCAQVFLLREGKLLASATPAQLRHKADGLAFVATPGEGEPARALQARLLDDHAHVVDAVPQGGAVRFIRRDPDGKNDAAPGALAVAARLEDGFMLLLDAAGAHGDANAAGGRDAGNAANDASPAKPPASAASLASLAANTQDVVIDVEHVTRKFGDFTAVADTSFEVRRGEVFGLLGPNGAGKTTTFRMLCGLLPATAGTLRVAGVDMRTARASARKQIGYVAQKFALYASLSVRENLRFFAGAYGLVGRAVDARVEQSLVDFGLGSAADSPSGQLPGGFRQRLAMAAALLHEPEILFLDEPTSGADPLARRSFWRRITALAAHGTTVVVTTHFMEEAEYCDRIVIQDAGRVLAIGTPAEVRAQAGVAAKSGVQASMEEAFIRVVERSRNAEAQAA